ncbi:phosphoribosylamine--glycine ligase [Microlunatus endophyticus]|uniref:Phosphoribosylamine--glycine ligase n=1 Tax=Microlunatus endophyticus TaxID=1716077 RepID=A0A917W5B5_9ACTN|nr:phosphoribosylamine--glycine ligase [Microlunatus endophyticus]GGL64434.1 phosphoribosylamine--glycine ligase [Microlunatus endophyticus]
MSVLVVGNGAREHAIALALSRDPEVGDLYVAPGNPGTAAIAENRAVDADNPAAVAALATELGVDLVVVGPEAPLVAGVADAVRLAGIPVFGPNAAAARIEGSKAFAKEIMTAAGVPTAAAVVCTDAGEARQALEEFGAPYVVKDDGLAAGKGVIVTDDLRAAIEHAAHCGRVVIEEFLDGPEVSLFAFVDGRTVVPLQPAQDFKRAHDDDQGPNTGGMGAYTPLPWAPDDLVQQVVDTVIQPTVDELARRGAPFVGLLYTGLALTSRGIRVVEFNARFGDPETQPLLIKLDTPLGGVLYAAATGKLADLAPLRWKPGAAVGVVLASEGYPEQPVTGRVITGLDDVPVPVLQAGTSTDDRGQLVSSGGRVLTVVGLGEDLHAARDQAYAEIAKIKLEGAFYRTDIALAAAEGKVEIRS